ncbi:MAG: hypothetical protein NTV88_03580 [Candidatus Micrarchaeota archaeon]|nr:hypothetical protein [Candidatus Micrarchaeota archaeon]
MVFKEKPDMQFGFTSEHADEFGRRFCIRLLHWSNDGRWSITLGLATKTLGGKGAPKFTKKRISLPVEFLPDLKEYAPKFVDGALAKLKEYETVKKAKQGGD